MKTILQVLRRPDRGKRRGHQGKRMENLRQSTLARAFSGELMTTRAKPARPEDYEPVEMLIERIRGQTG